MSSGGCRNLSWSAWSRCSSPMRMIRAPFGPCPGEDGKSPGRTSPCGGAVYLLDEADIVICERGARGSAFEIRRARARLGYSRGDARLGGWRRLLGHGHQENQLVHDERQVELILQPNLLCSEPFELSPRVGNQSAVLGQAGIAG